MPCVFAACLSICVSCLPKHIHNSLLQDSALICRYAVLRAAALHLPYAQDLYGTPSLTLTALPAAADAAAAVDSSSSAAGGVSEGKLQQDAAAAAGGADGGGVQQVTGGDAQVQEMELRLGGTLGIEVR